jgi:hypothetical protein
MSIVPAFFLRWMLRQDVHMPTLAQYATIAFLPKCMPSAILTLQYHRFFLLYGEMLSLHALRLTKFYLWHVIPWVQKQNNKHLVS